MHRSARRPPTARYERFSQREPRRALTSDDWLLVALGAAVSIPRGTRTIGLPIRSAPWVDPHAPLRSGVPLRLRL